MNGTFIADVCHEIDGEYEKVGAILYFRSHHCKVKFIKSPPVGKNIIGKFIESDKLPDAPMVEGDLMLNGATIGHIHSQQNEKGDTLYWMRVSIHIPAQGVPLWIKVKLEDE